MKKLFLTVSLAAVLTIGVGASGGDFGTNSKADGKTYGLKLKLASCLKLTVKHDPHSPHPLMIIIRGFYIFSESGVILPL